MDELKSPGKPFVISKWEVWEAYRQVRANQGAPGVDGCSIGEFEADLQGNLYKIWNRMSSGSYFPPPVKAVEIPKPHGGGTRMLGVPTVADRIAQTVVARRLEEKVEPIFHPDSYGYRPGRSAQDAAWVCRERCWRYDWVVDLDIQKFFDSVRHDLVVKAVQAHTDLPWVLLYVRRWLTAPLRLPDGTLQERDRGTPQGSAISPVLANLFMHYAFDAWMAREHPGVPFERYADDVVVHCTTERQARQLVAAVGNRMVEVGLRLHPAKTKIVYCKDGNRRLDHEHTAFTFLGYTFRARGARGRHGTFTSFLPAISKDALNKVSGEVRRWRLHRKTGLSGADLARWINPIIRGWMQYCGAFYRSALYPLLRRINAYLMRWLRNKHKRLRSIKRPAPAGNAPPASTRAGSPTGHGSAPPGDQHDKSPVTGDCHAGICGGRRVRLPPATRPKRVTIPEPFAGRNLVTRFGKEINFSRPGALAPINPGATLGSAVIAKDLIPPS